MGIQSLWSGFQRWIGGWPDNVLSVVLLATAGVIILVALRATALEKAIVLGWVLFP